MKYTYIYKTSDGVRHEDTMNAKSREDVFETLRGRGIKAIKVIAADGSKANGEIRGVRKRVVALVAVIAAVVTGILLYGLSGAWSGRRDVAEGEKFEARPLPRQEIRGSRARVSSAAKSLGTRAERFLALFAEPGRAVSVTEADWPSKAEFEALLKKKIEYTEDEFTEQIDMKRIVSWLKKEYSRYVSGGGYTSGYIKDLVKRQGMEVEMREKHNAKLLEILSKRDLRNEDKTLAVAYKYWLSANAQLQAAGIYPIPLPYVLEDYQSTHGAED